jgi:colanic acid biosynthesis glycosyl transferase WcaI
MRNRLVKDSKDLDNVRFLDLQAPDRIASLLSTADIHLLPQRAEASDCVLPSKLGSILASGRPVIAMAAEGSQLAAEVEGCGVAVPPGDVSALVNAILALADDTQQRTELGMKARSAALARWEKRAILEKFENELLVLKTKRDTREPFSSASTEREVDTAP